MARRRRGPRLGKTGCLFWLLILVVIVIVILYRGKGSFRDTFRSLKKGVGRTAVSVEESVEKAEEDKQPVVVIEQEPEPLPEKEPSPGPEREPAAVREEPKTEPKKEPASTTEQTIKTKRLNATLYFVKINESDGSAKPFAVSRTVEYKDSPITRTMEALLAGSTKKEKESGIVSFIPAGTRLISAQISNGLLTLNFSGKLEENYSGREAILLEISQITLTAFSFDAVQRVSILIEGERKEYITGEGIPLRQYYTQQDISRLLSGG